MMSRDHFSIKAAINRIGLPWTLCIGAVIGASLGIAVGIATSAFAIVNDTPKTAAAPPSAKNAGLAASFLVGRHAEASADGHVAVDFYNRAMELDPQNLSLLQSAFFLAAQTGDYPAAVRAASRAYDTLPRKGLAGVILAVDHTKRQEYAQALGYLDKSGQPSVATFSLPILRAWAVVTSQPIEAALAELEPMKNFRESDDLVTVMTAMLNEYYGRKDDALAQYNMLASRIETSRLSLLRSVAEGYRRLGKDDQVKDVFARYIKAHNGSPILDSYAAGIMAMPPQKVTPQQGMAEALYAVAELLVMSEPNEFRAQISTAYAQSALYLNPDLDIARRFIGTTLAARGRYAESNAVLGNLKKSTPGYLDVQMQIAENYLRLNRNGDATSILLNILKERPNWTDAHVALGDILRDEKKYAEAITAYDSALKHAPADKAENWVIHYARGVAAERAKNWDKAEKDLLKALELRPNEPNVLNYLGYSYLDRGEKMAEARRLIESAYKQRPNDGYIIDSYGWSLYKAGEYDKAVVSLEKAVEASPSDGTINEHLGDVYWKVGRRNEARFQWQRSLGLEIEDAQRDAIRTKLERGLAQQ